MMQAGRQAGRQAGADSKVGQGEANGDVAERPLLLIRLLFVCIFDDYTCLPGADADQGATLAHVHGGTSQAVFF